MFPVAEHVISTAMNKAGRESAVFVYAWLIGSSHTRRPMKSLLLSVHPRKQIDNMATKRGCRRLSHGQRNILSFLKPKPDNIANGILDEIMKSVKLNFATR